METQKKLVEAIERSAPLAEVVRLYAFHVLEKMGGNKVHTAERIQIDRRTLQRWERQREARG